MEYLIKSKHRIANSEEETHGENGTEFFNHIS